MSLPSKLDKHESTLSTPYSCLLLVYRTPSKTSSAFDGSSADRLDSEMAINLSLAADVVFHRQFSPVLPTWQQSFLEWPVLRQPWSRALSMQELLLTTMPNFTFSPPAFSSKASSNTTFRKTWKSCQIEFLKRLSNVYTHHNLLALRWLFCFHSTVQKDVCQGTTTAVSYVLPLQASA